jgi:hypothetical protein
MVCIGDVAGDDAQGGVSSHRETGGRSFEGIGVAPVDHQ